MNFYGGLTAVHEKKASWKAFCFNKHETKNTHKRLGLVTTYSYKRKQMYFIKNALMLVLLKIITQISSICT